MRVLILSGGTVTDLNWLAGVINVNDHIICVDGGAKYAAALGITPQIIIGDLDSVDRMELAEFIKKGTVVKEYSADKDDTDTTLALKEALVTNPDEIIILGAIGTRMDHTLSNMHLLLKAMQSGVSAHIINECNEISLVTPDTHVVVEGEPGDVFSLLPLTEKVSGINVQGARWPLKDAIFYIGNSYGVSNQLSLNRAEISISTGMLLLIRINERGAMNCR